MNPGRPLAVTLGEPSGVGPELALMAYAARNAQTPSFVCLADPDVLRERGRRIGLQVPIRMVSRAEDATAIFPEALPVLPLINRQRETPGRLDPVNAAGTIEAIDRATALALDGHIGGVVTGPIDKKALYDAGFRHPGHTEYLADLCSRRLGPRFQPVMLLFGPDLACVPVTIHIPLADVAEHLTTDLIVDTCRITARGYRERLGLPSPRLTIAGLNPHAGERGAIGQEDERVVRPAVERLKAEGIDAVGPLPADTMFHREARQTYDVAICMYHDQALIPAKTLAFDETVNVTLGLPILRTSPDHGTAAGIAGTGTARPDSFIAALLLAGRMAAQEKAGMNADRQAARA